MRQQTVRRRGGRRPTAEALLAARLRHANKGAGRAGIIRGWAAGIGERVEPASPALDHWARDRWELARLAQLQRQLDDVWERRRGSDASSGH
jgi:hypothetical protein